MIEPNLFFEALKARGIDFYTGVPDSLLANFCAFLEEGCDSNQHLIAANEGNCVALAMGYNLATGQVGAVYMQNSGLGNSVNPLVSLTDPEVYKVPMLLIIGWRGEPGYKDEPQHIKQGRITLQQLDLLEIPYSILDGESMVDEILDSLFKKMVDRNAPVALVVRKNTFAKYQSSYIKKPEGAFIREHALKSILELCEKQDIVISTTGKTSREVFELRAAKNQAQKDFMMVGGMGHTSSVALGVAIGMPNRRVVCLDGDGSLLMHMGAIPVIANFKPNKFFHVLLNNRSHESVGGQPTAAGVVDFEKLALGSGYVAYASASNEAELLMAWKDLCRFDGPVMLEVKIRSGSRDDLGRPNTTAEENKLAFIKAISANPN
jgi:phosphonopyruvate decarboxylase